MTQLSANKQRNAPDNAGLVVLYAFTLGQQTLPLRVPLRLGQKVMTVSDLVEHTVVVIT